MGNSSLSQATYSLDNPGDTVPVRHVAPRPRQYDWPHEHRPRLVSSAPDTHRLDAADIQLLGLLAEGLPLEAVGRRLELSDRTIRRRARAVCDRIGVRAPIQAVAWAARRGLI